MANSSNEERFLLFVIRNGIRGIKIKESDVPQEIENLDWNEVLRLAFENRVASLLYFALSRLIEGGVVPPPQLNILKKFYHETAQKNLKIKSHLIQILTALEANGIEVTVLKGALLAFSIWPNMATRQMQDIDIVIPRDKVYLAYDILNELGYVYSDKIYPIEWHLTHRKELSSFVDPVSDIEIELHYRFFTPNPTVKVDESPFWSRSKKIDIAGCNAKVLGSEELFVHLCLHVSVGHFLQDNMRSLLDLLLVLESNSDSLDEKIISSHLKDPHTGPLIAFPVFACARYLKVDFGQVIPNAENALALHFSGIKLKILERAAERFLLKIHHKSISEWAHVRLAKKIIYEPKVSYFGMLTCFIFAQDGITHIKEQKSIFEKLKGTTIRRSKLFTQFLISRFSKKTTN